MSRLPDELDVKLYMVGDGPMQSELEAMASEAVTFLGKFPMRRWHACIGPGDVLVLPSRAEGLPRTVLETMASGLPVVVSDLEQVAPVVGDSGATVPVGDVDGYVSGLEEMLAGEYEDPRSVIEGPFDWTETVARTTEILEGIVFTYGNPAT